MRPCGHRLEALKARVPALVAPPGDDICYATQNRQQAIKEIAPQCGLVLVMGSANSSGSRRLAEVALAAGAPDAHLIDTVSEWDEAWLTGVETIGVTSGASVPEILVTQLLDHLAAQGYTDIETPSTIAEPQIFALPRSLTHG